MHTAFQKRRRRRVIRFFEGQGCRRVSGFFNHRGHRGNEFFSVSSVQASVCSVVNALAAGWGVVFFTTEVTEGMNFLCFLYVLRGKNIP